MAIAGADRIKLTEHIAVMDLMALGRVMLLPEDDLSLAALLKSPLIGLDEDQLFAHRPRPREDDAVVGPRRGGGDPAGAFAEARRRLDAWRARRRLPRPLRLLSPASSAPDGGRARFLRRLGAEAEDVLDEFLAQALAFEDANTPSLEGFLAWLEAAEPTSAATPTRSATRSG